MKSGKSLVQLAEEIERRSEAKADFIAPMSKMEMTVIDDKPALALDTGGTVKVKTFGVNKIAHDQISQYVKIPRDYYQRMAVEDPKLLATNVNRWIHDEAKSGERRLIRTLDGNARALLSNKYRALENEDLAEAILPVLLDGNFDIKSCEITDSRLYIKAISKDIEKDVPTGHKMGDGTHTIFDTVCPAITIGNSEVGYGALYVESGVYTKACTNLAMFGAKMRKYHTGARAELSDDVYEMLSDQTKLVTDAAVWGQVRDLVRGAFNQKNFEEKVERLTLASKDRLDDDVVQVVEKVAKKFTFNEGEKKGVLARLIEGGDLSRYGLHSAITRHSADVEDYDRATNLEQIGGEVITLDRSQWSEILAKAA